MRRIALLVTLGALLLAAKVDVRIVSSYPSPTSSPAYNAFMTFLQDNPDIREYLMPPNFGLALTTPPNPKQVTGLLLLFDERATTGNITQDKLLALQYVRDVILNALKSGLRVAIVSSPKSSLGQLVLYYLGIIVVPKCSPSVKPITVTKEHPIYKGVQLLPGTCCMVPLVPDLVAPESLGMNGKYCVIIRLTKLGDEMIIMSWKDIYRDISSNPNAQQLLKNVILYLAHKIKAKYPKVPYTVTITKTVTETTTTTLINNVTIVVSTTSWLTTTIYKTVTTTLLSTIKQFVTTTLTKTLYETVTSTVTTTKTVTSILTSKITLTSIKTVTTTLTNTIYKTLYSTVTTTVTEVKTDIKSVGGAAVGGIILGIVLALALKGMGSSRRRTALTEEW